MRTACCPRRQQWPNGVPVQSRRGRKHQIHAPQLLRRLGASWEWSRHQRRSVQEHWRGQGSCAWASWPRGPHGRRACSEASRGRRSMAGTGHEQVVVDGKRIRAYHGTKHERRANLFGAKEIISVGRNAFNTRPTIQGVSLPVFAPWLVLMARLPTLRPTLRPATRAAGRATLKRSVRRDMVGSRETATSTSANRSGTNRSR